ncbi:hypothetical protein Aca07nite_73850 [Actinoplanes capillaceus]|uniref:DUF3040 domain-containing protein n=1 Tax=Actinoplanes campanulatus TaxID=113559 RepID=A0ABQ3WUY3_9ACTN|nr:DUF3040 domain-containing protein [Actinoplanes capillaceus]GID50110.1 hypothetical protein Aca07nite_73850 [Actinoplanes capillaceus]
MLSKEDSRRLAQLERQLRRDDPDFCARMGGGNFSVSPTGFPPLPLFILSALVTAVAIVLAVVGWWIVASIATAWAAVTTGAAAHRLRRRREVRSWQRPAPRSDG